MIRPFAAVLAATLLLAPTAPPALAQAPKAGPYYEEGSDLGFKVKVPDGWEFIPPAPDEGNIVATYEPKVPKYINMGGEEILFIHCWILSFDRRESSKEGLERKSVSVDIPSWIKRREQEIGTQFHQVEADEVTIDKVPCTELLFEGKSSANVSSGRGGVPVYVYAMLYKLAPDLEVALVFNAPVEDWGKWKKPLASMAKSFKRVEVERAATSSSAMGSTLRDQKRARLQAEIAKAPGWVLYETPNYFIISNNPDADFIEELKRRLEAIREVYEKDYPIEKALAAKRARAERATTDAGSKTTPADGDGEEEGESESAAASKPGAEPADPMERSRTSVVRVCLNQDQYHSYGGPGGSAGYWNSRDEELVVYDDKASGGRGDTWITLNHEAFHQYIFYFYGNIAPHSWYNEGTGDYYSGYQINKRGKFELERNDWRLRTIQQNIREARYCPLKELVKWTQSQYYGNNEYKLGGGDNYAQGWAFVYFLRTGKKNKAKGWDPAWDGILETYLDTLAGSGDLDEAIDKAFAGVDWIAMEEAWKEYTLR
jgi:hypothetical protein